MPIHPAADTDPLGLVADTEGIAMPLSEWRGIARLGLTFDQVVRLYGHPPKAALPFFGPKTKVAQSAGRPRRARPSVAHRPTTRA
jgi:hypothetical protein